MVNNNRSWFLANKTRYETEAIEPQLRFVAAMSKRLGEITPHFEAIPKKQGGSLFRIYKDTRFSKDKRPYREYAAMRFSHQRLGGVHGPCFYVHLEPGKIMFAAGIWQPSSEHLFLIRQRIKEKPMLWQDTLAQLDASALFSGIEGQRLVRPPQGFSKHDTYIEDIKYKSFFALHECTVAIATSPDLIPTTLHTFNAAMPLLHFICDALGLDS